MLNKINCDNLIDNFALKNLKKYHNFNYFINLKNLNCLICFKSPKS